MSYSTLNSGASRPPPAPGPLIADQAAALCALSQGAGGGGPEALLGTSLPISITGMLHFVPGAGEERRLQLTWASDPAATSKANMPTLPLPPRWGGFPGARPLSISWLGRGPDYLVKPPCPGRPLAGGQHWSLHTGDSCSGQRVGGTKANLGTFVGRKPSPQGRERKEPVWFARSLVQP